MVVVFLSMSTGAFKLPTPVDVDMARLLLSDDEDLLGFLPVHNTDVPL